MACPLKNLHGNDQSAKTGERLDAVYGDYSRSPRHNGAASGEPNIHAPDGGADAPATRRADRRRVDPLVSSQAI